MAPLAEIAAPLVAPMLEPILQDVGQALGSTVGSAAGGLLGGIGKDFGGIIEQMMQSFNPLSQLMGGSQNQGFCPSNPSPFSSSGFPSGILQNPFPFMPQFGGSTSSGGANSWSDMAANAAGGQSWSQLQSNLQSAEQSGDPAKLQAATAQINQYTQFVEMMSQAEKAQHDALQAISRNISG